MPCAHDTTPWEESLFRMAEERRRCVGFDGPFALPTEQRVMLEVADAGRQLALVQAIQHLGLDAAAASRLCRAVYAADTPQSVGEVEQLFARAVRG